MPLFFKSRSARAFAGWHELSEKLVPSPPDKLPGWSLLDSPDRRRRPRAYE